jgi:hypothetical protein
MKPLLPLTNNSVTTKDQAKPPREEQQNKETHEVYRQSVFSAAESHKTFKM